MFCLNCGTKNEDGSKFCIGCGAELETVAEPVAADPFVEAQPQPEAQYAPQYDVQYTQPVYNTVPPVQLKADWSLLMYILLGMVTCGIYPIYVLTKMANDLDTIASPYDGKKTMNFLLMAFLLSPVTCCIYTFVWYHQFSERIGLELKRRGIAMDFGSKDYWLWNVLGSFIGIGPFIYMYKLCEAMNALAADYNARG